MFRVLAESMGLQVSQREIVTPEYLSQCYPPPSAHELPLTDDVDEQLRKVLQLSEAEQQEVDRQRRQEEEELEMILKLSLTEK